MECISKDTIVSKPPRGLANNHSAQIEDLSLTIEEIVEPTGPVVMKHRGRPTRYNDDGTAVTKPIDPIFFHTIIY